DRREDRGLVHRVAREAIELVGEDIACERRIARRERRGLAVEVDALEVLGLDDLERDVVTLEAGAQPAEQQVRLRGRAVDADRADAGDAGPERGEQGPPARRPGP